MPLVVNDEERNGFPPTHLMYVLMPDGRLRVLPTHEERVARGAEDGVKVRRWTNEQMDRAREWVDVSAPDASTPCKFTGALAVSLTGTATPDGS